MSAQNRVNVLFIDNFDSFVFNLVDEFAKRGCDVQVWRNDISVQKALEIARSLSPPRLVVISPGPSTPESAGCSLELLRNAPADLPFFGVCLGHQAIIEAFGGTVERSETIVHGKASKIDHCGKGAFSGLPSPIPVGRYHSLKAGQIPAGLEITAHLNEMVMAVRHTERPIVGVQFHPESILTPLGGKLIENIIEFCRQPEA